MAQGQFQSVVNFVNAPGTPGDLAAEAPLVSQSVIVDSDGVTPNTIGFGASYITNVIPFGEGQNTVQTGNPTGTAVFAGIMANSKEQASFGGKSGPLSPTLDLADKSQVSVVSEGHMWVYMNTPSNIGDVVVYNNVTGELSCYPPSAVLPIGSSNAYATVYQFSNSAPGLCRIWLNPGVTGL